MPKLSDLSIPVETLSQARAGETAALEAIYRACLPGVRTLVRRLVTRPAVAEELVHDVFVQLLRKLKTFTGAGPFGAWVRTITVSCCLMHLRSPWNRAAVWFERESLEETMETAGMADETLARSRQEDECLERALATLAPLARTVVWLHDVEGCTHAEIAAQLGRSVSFSKSQLARAHERLRRQLQNSEERVACTPASTSC